MILALDLALKTGWACGNPCGPVVYGSFRLREEIDPHRFLELVRKVGDLIEAHGVTGMVAEAPFIGKRKNTAMALYGYRAAAMIACANKRVKVHDLATPATIRKHFTGTGGLRRADAKEAVIEKCRWLGHAPENDDVADALALWHYQCSLLSGAHLTMMMVKDSFSQD